MKFKSMAVALLLACVPLHAQAHTAFLSQVDLFHQGENGVNTYRIPALVQSAKGTLIAVVDARRDSSHDLPAHISLVMRRSFDDGKNWQPMQTIMKVNAGGVGDASLLLDRSNGRIWCFFSYGPPGIGFQNAKPGAVTGDTTLQVHAMHTDDDGMTWSPQIDLTPQIKDPAWQAVFAASGTDIQLKSGRFLLPLVARDHNGVIHSLNAYSDDHGSTWKHGSFIGDHTDESHSVELKDGTVMQNMRDGKSRAVALSHDSGITFGAVTHDAALVDPGCNAGIVRYHFGGTDALIFTNAASTRRENLTVKLSYDDGRTWPQQRTLYAGPAAYSTVIQLHDGSVGVLYEHGNVDSIERITFARFNLAWIDASQK